MYRVDPHNLHLHHSQLWYNGCCLANLLCVLREAEDVCAIAVCFVGMCIGVHAYVHVCGSPPLLAFPSMTQYVRVVARVILNEGRSDG